VFSIFRNHLIPDASEYKRDLKFQLEDKQRLMKEDLRRERKLNTLHFTAFETFWGRPGAGAPNLMKKKGNLFNLLHSTHIKT